MARQSERLISLGYYNQEERPYKENLKRIFHKKRKSYLSSSHVSDPDSAVDETTAPSSGTVVEDAPLNDPERLSTISHSFGDGWDSLATLDQPSASAEEESDTPAPDSTRPAHSSDYGEQPSETYWFMCIALSLLPILLCFLIPLFQRNCFHQEHPNLAQWETSYSEYWSMKDLQEELMQLREELAHLRTKLLPKGLSMPNFALESQGARILHAHPSESYRSPSQPPLVMFLSVPMFYPHHSSRIVIQNHTPLLVPGRCWSFAGQRGEVLISLSQPIRVSHVTLGHISRDHTPYGFMHSAPQHFSVSGYLSEDVERIHLGTFEYNLNGDSFQTFELPANAETFKFVLLEILTNWGHPEYTCVYSFKVHGDPN